MGTTGQLCTDVVIQETLLLADTSMGSTGQLCTDVVIKATLLVADWRFLCRLTRRGGPPTSVRGRLCLFRISTSGARCGSIWNPQDIPDSGVRHPISRAGQRSPHARAARWPSEPHHDRRVRTHQHTGLAVVEWDVRFFSISVCSWLSLYRTHRCPGESFGISRGSV